MLSCSSSNIFNVGITYQKQTIDINTYLSGSGIELDDGDEIYLSLFGFSTLLLEKRCVSSLSTGGDNEADNGNEEEEGELDSFSLLTSTSCFSSLLLLVLTSPDDAMGDGSVMEIARCFY